jgi:ATP-dependent DNA ligase
VALGAEQSIGIRCAVTIGILLLKDTTNDLAQAIGVKALYPGFVEPALATSNAKVPAGSRWIHEIKFDSYRVQVHRANGAVKVYTRRGHDWTSRFRKVADEAWHVSAGSAIIDARWLCRPKTAQQTSRSSRMS